MSRGLPAVRPTNSASLLLLAAVLFSGTPVCGDETAAAAGKKPPADEKPLSSKQSPSFAKEVRPILQAKCVSCHGGTTRKGELDLRTPGSIEKGGESGRILDRKAPGKSILFEHVRDRVMPPKGKGKLSDEEISIICRWIKAGAILPGVNPARVRAINQHDVMPILQLRCAVCHGLRKREAGLDVRTRASLLKGGKSGAAIVLGKPQQSLILKRIHAGEMPPRRLLIKVAVKPISEAEIKTLTRWIAAGAPEFAIKADVATVTPDLLVSEQDRRFWAFRSPQAAVVPHVSNAGQVRTPIDAFILRRLEEKRLSLSGEADRRTLIRRAHFDLIGLPPTPADVRAFVADRNPNAYERLIDRLLASPQYGERWGQYWLDLAGYSDSEGKRSADVIRQFAWKYRDYVIRAFNNDKPYDRFLLEQLAGDELLDYEHADALTGEMLDNLVATGFLRMAPDGTGSDIVNTVVERMEVVSDELDILGSVVMGLTIKCAQCHSHKYDPIPQRDYYRLVAVFKGAYDVHDWLKSTSVAGQTKGTPISRVLRYSTPLEKQQWKSEIAVIQEQIDHANA
ncbi:MAG: DUF1549 domain-containing protein, partial [Planctomycetes bacterium]|nr:DUF1549 domain-containing protein [Planctomycetota bacterium]